MAAIVALANCQGLLQPIDCCFAYSVNQTSTLLLAISMRALMQCIQVLVAPWFMLPHNVVPENQAWFCTANSHLNAIAAILQKEYTSGIDQEKVC